MQVYTRIDKLLLACALAVCAAAFATGGQDARAYEEMDYCEYWYGCKGGPDNCLREPGGLTCFKKVATEEEALQ